MAEQGEPGVQFSLESYDFVPAALLPYGKHSSQHPASPTPGSDIRGKSVFTGLCFCQEVERPGALPARSEQFPAETSPGLEVLGATG